MTYLPANLFVEREGRKQDARPKEPETITLPPAPLPPPALPEPPPQPTWVEQPIPREIVIERPQEPAPKPIPTPIVTVPAPTPTATPPALEPTITTPKPEAPRKKRKIWESWKPNSETDDERIPRQFVGVLLAGLSLLLVLWGVLNILPKSGGFPEKHLRAEHLVPKLKVKQDRVAKPAQPLLPVAQHMPPAPVITPIVPSRPVVHPPIMPPAPPFKDTKPHLHPSELKPDNPPLIPASRYQVARDPLTDNDYKVFLQREVAPMYNPLKPSVSSLVLAALMANTLLAQQPNVDLTKLEDRIKTLEGIVAKIDAASKQDLKLLETTLAAQIAKLATTPPPEVKSELVLQLIDRLNKLDNKIDKDLAELRKAPPVLPPVVPPPAQSDATAEVRKIIDQLKELTTAVNALRPQEKISLFPPTTANKPEPKDNFVFFNAFDEDLLITVNNGEPKRVQQGGVLNLTVPVGVVTYQVRTPSGWVGQPNTVTLAEGQKHVLGAKVPPGR